jgi:hypothetical protein
VVYYLQIPSNVPLKFIVFFYKGKHQFKKKIPALLKKTFLTLFNFFVVKKLCIDYKFLISQAETFVLVAYEI